MLYSFGAYPTSGDGFGPNSPLVFDKSNHLYGTTYEGGVAGCFQGCGTVFELLPNGNGGWKERVIHAFRTDGTDGELPTGGVTFDNNGNLYGTTQNGGTANSGVLYQLTRSSTKDVWVESIAHQFVGGTNDGSFPVNVTLFADHAGNLYGTTEGGGANGHGAVFEATYSKSNGWSIAILYSFQETYSGDGNDPQAGVTMDEQGNLYGTTNYGGAFNYYGTVFKLSKSNGIWTETILHSFTGGTDGFYPQSDITISNGWVYGTTMLGGGNGWGVVYQVKP